MTDEVLHQFLIDVPEARAGKLAIDSSRGSLNYGQLEDRVSRLSKWLIGRGCGKQDRIAICLPKRIATVEFILATLYAGAVYVPVDYTAPAERIKKIMEDAGALMLITLPEISSLLVNLEVEPNSIVAISNLDKADATDSFIAEFSPGSPVKTEPDDLAAFLYTSGSTGTPKGVMLSHRNIATFSRWVVDKFNLGETDRLSSHAPFHFDLSTMDLYSSFMAGASVYIFDEVEKRFPSTVSKIIQDKKITSWYSVPSALMLLEEKGSLARRDFSSLRQIFFAGEVYPLPSLRKIMLRLPEIKFINLYGPTETNVCTYYQLESVPPEDVKSIPIGKACEHYKLSILDENDNEVEPGETGEICIQGSGVMKGYWKAPEKTASSRVNKQDDTYRTGDYGVMDSQGYVLYAGRKDSQVKIQGYRVELSEVENVANTHPKVKESAAVVIEDNNIKKIYLCVASPCDDGLDSGSVAAWCSNQLPVYAMPENILVMDQFGRTSTGKIDRQSIKQIVNDWIQGGLVSA